MCNVALPIVVPSVTDRLTGCCAARRRWLLPSELLPSSVQSEGLAIVMIANFATLGVVTFCWGALVVPGGFGLIAIALQVQASHKPTPFDCVACHCAAVQRRNKMDVPCNNPTTFPRRRRGEAPRLPKAT
jgi:hypothetical protein